MIFDIWIFCIIILALSPSFGLSECLGALFFPFVVASEISFQKPLRISAKKRGDTMSILITICGSIALVIALLLGSILNVFRLMVRFREFWLGQLSLLACLILVLGFGKGFFVFFLAFWLLDISSTVEQLKEVFENR